MNLGWQDVVALTLVLAAIAHLWRRFRRAARGACGCGSCRGCPRSSADQPLVVIQLPRLKDEPGDGA
jgi:hypothetical protein